ncbi:MAG: hypothetical protein DMG78_00700 [Acidobacteria bacterium]|nr:MAG: hypothetical protein DMG78_00700 [Acidobacteriota bacterium]
MKVTAILDTLSVSYLSMATTTTKPDIETADVSGANLPAWPHAPAKDAGANDVSRPSQRDALQALLAFSALHDQVRRRKALASQRNGFDSPTPPTEFEPTELFVLDEVLQLVAEPAPFVPIPARASTAPRLFREPASAPRKSSTATTPRPTHA